MHEVGLAQRMLEIALETAQANGGGLVRGARLLLGQYAGADAETLRFAFDIAARGTPAEGCLLEIVKVPARLACRSCGTEFGGELLEPCPACGHVGATVLQGRELRLDSLDLEDPSPLPDEGTRRQE